MGKLKHAIAVAVLTLVTTVGLYFLFRGMFALPTAASSQAEPIDTMFQSHFLMMAFLFAFICDDIHSPHSRARPKVLPRGKPTEKSGSWGDIFKLTEVKMEGNSANSANYIRTWSIIIRLTEANRPGFPIRSRS